jgi:methyl-accepting chemotaxis protein/methyl-accepting chemotaxis protein-1 (serine sensor receptor)
MATKPALQLVQIEGQELARQQQKASSQMSAMTWSALCLVVIGTLIAIAVILTIRRISRLLCRIATDLANGGHELTTAAAHVSTSSQGLAQGASEQAAALEETSASTQEITARTHKNADSARSAAGLMQDTARKIVGGNQRLDEMVHSMDAINSSSAKISKIIKTIDDIAFQTNILALNAAVEAARAGEAGMGFSVVADAVRTLAQRSAQAARDTSSLIEESIHTSTAGSAKLNQVSSAISEITHDSVTVKDIVDEMSLDSQAQNHDLDQITTALGQMEQVTQQIAANAEESAAASEQLNAQADSLHAIVSELQTLVSGTSGGRHPRTPLNLVPYARQRLPEMV